MKKIVLALYVLMTIAMASLNGGCYAEIRGPRWHYDHDYNDGWRANHPWHQDRNDWDH